MQFIYLSIAFFYFFSFSLQTLIQCLVLFLSLPLLLLLFLFCCGCGITQMRKRSVFCLWQQCSDALLLPVCSSETVFHPLRSTAMHQNSASCSSPSFYFTQQGRCCSVEPQWLKAEMEHNSELHLSVTKLCLSFFPLSPPSHCFIFFLWNIFFCCSISPLSFLGSIKLLLQLPNRILIHPILIFPNFLLTAFSDILSVCGLPVSFPLALPFVILCLPLRSLWSHLD